MAKNSGLAGTYVARKSNVVLWFKDKCMNYVHYVCRYVQLFRSTSKPQNDASVVAQRFT